jgi:HPt (histidine-containing phosphotransfer) domain-containing protein
MNGNFVFDQRLDGEFLGSIYEGDMEHAEMVFEKFLDTIGPQMDEIRSNYHSQDVESFRKSVHKIKPVLSYVGLTVLTNQAALLENQCKEIPVLEQVSGLYNAFSNGLTEMIPVIEGELIKIRNL